MTGSARIRFVRLTEVPPDAVGALLTEPRNARHLPLAGAMDADAVAGWIRAKDAQWAANGYGPEAILIDGSFAGWGGFQREAWPDGTADADLALVLSPAHWGSGAEIADALLDRAFGELGLASVTIALPHTRRADRVLARLGFEPDGEVVLDDVPFRRFRLTADRWRAGASDPPPGRAT